ncbi:MAG TPA: hypothetical protein VF316_16215 [Polyangiaceae bacterium]
MIKRLLYGLVFGLIVGGLLAAALIKGLGMLAFIGTGGGALAYVFAAVTGILVGLVAGKPIWASGGQIEAGLKAFFGALLASGLMFAMRRWVHVDVPLGGLGLGPIEPTELGNLPAVTLPAIAMLLGAFYEADNTPEADKDKDKDKAKKDEKSGKPAGKVRVATDADADATDEEQEEPKKAKK